MGHSNRRSSESIDAFNRDIEAQGGYSYTDMDRLSVRLATDTTKKLVERIGDFTDSSVLDIGCGDGHFTFHYWDTCHPSRMVAIDGASAAVEEAERRKGARTIEFRCCDAHRLPFPDDSFDIALLHSVLHHDDDPADMIREAFRVAGRVVIHEPNGANLGLKLIEMVSPYHREHRETSYTFGRIRRWIEAAGGEVESVEFAGFVPMFSPDRLASTMKRMELALEAVPGVNGLACSVQAISARRRVTEHETHSTSSVV